MVEFILLDMCYQMPWLWLVADRLYRSSNPLPPRQQWRCLLLMFLPVACLYTTLCLRPDVVVPFFWHQSTCFMLEFLRKHRLLRTCPCVQGMAQILCVHSLHFWIQSLTLNANKFSILSNQSDGWEDVSTRRTNFWCCVMLRTIIGERLLLHKIASLAV